MDFGAIEIRGINHPSSFDNLVFGRTPPRASPEPHFDLEWEGGVSAWEGEGFIDDRPSQDDWSPQHIRAWDRERFDNQLAAQKKLGEEQRIAAEARGGPEPGASFDDIRVYTKRKNGGYKYWGVRAEDETLEEFWAKQDPGNTRSHDDDPEVEDRHESASLPRSPSPHMKAPAKRGRPRGTPVLNANNRVKKSTKTSTPVNKTTRRSLASKLDAGNQVVAKQVQENREGPTSSQNKSQSLATGKASKTQTKTARETNNLKAWALSSSTKKIVRGAAPRPGPEPAMSASKPAKKAQSTKAPVPSSSSERPRRGRPVKETPTKGKPGRGRPPKGTPAKDSAEKQKTSAVKGNARITKSKQTRRPSEPSTHKMRTRARGSVQVPGFF